MTVNDGNLVASGMLIIGELPEVPEGMRVWFEHPSVSVVKVGLTILTRKSYPLIAKLKRPITFICNYWLTFDTSINN